MIAGNSFGWVNLVLAFVLSTLGLLLTVVLATKASGRAGRGRGRLLVYAAVALGAVGIFQAEFIALLGYTPPTPGLRYHFLTVLTGLGVAVGTSGAGLALVGFGQPGRARLAVAGVVIGTGAAAAHCVVVNGMRAVGDLYYEPMELAAATVIGITVAVTVLWFILYPRRMRSAALATSVAGAGMCGLHYVAVSALQPEPGLFLAVDGSQPAIGFTPMVLMAPAVLLGAGLTAMLWFFTVGTSTVDDLRAIFEHPENSVEIEPWMIAEVSRRVALSHRSPLPVSATSPGAGGAARIVIVTPPPRAETTRVHVPPDRYPPGYRPYRA